MQKSRFCKNDGPDSNDKGLLLIVESDSITRADKEFEQQTAAKGNSFSVTLAPLKNVRKTKGADDDAEE